MFVDEVGMAGKQFMGNIASRFKHAKSFLQNSGEDVLGGLSFIVVGDSAQCPPIKDQAFYDTTSRADQD